MTEVFEAMIHLAGGVGKVTKAMMYNDGFMTVEGETKDGQKYSITLNIEEENNND